LHRYPESYANEEAVSFSLEDIVVEKVLKEGFAFEWNSEFTITLGTALTEKTSSGRHGTRIDQSRSILPETLKLID